MTGKPEDGDSSVLEKPACRRSLSTGVPSVLGRLKCWRGPIFERLQYWKFSLLEKFYGCGSHSAGEALLIDRKI